MSPSPTESVQVPVPPLHKHELTSRPDMGLGVDINGPGLVERFQTHNREFRKKLVASIDCRVIDAAKFSLFIYAILRLWCASVATASFQADRPTLVDYSLAFSLLLLSPCIIIPRAGYILLKNLIKWPALGFAYSIKATINFASKIVYGTEAQL